MRNMRSASARPRMFVVAALAAVAALFGLSKPATAHDPIFIDEAQTSPDSGPYMPDGTISWALYGSVLANGDTRGFEFDLRDGDELYISLLIPNLAPETELQDGDLPIVELVAPDGSATTIAPEVREIFEEPFSSTSYVTLAEVREPGQAGRYRGTVVGTAPSRFTIAIGESEVFFTETERSGDRPGSFAEIAAPLQAWYSTPPGEEPTGDLAEGEGEIDLEMVEDAMESGEASAPDEALSGEDSTASDGDTGGGDADGQAAPASSDSEADTGGSTTWVAPAVLAAIVLAGGGLFAMRRRGGARA